MSQDNGHTGAAGAAVDTVPTPTLKPKPDWRAVLLFCVLTYALSWGWWGIRFAPFWGPLMTSGQPISRTQIGAFDVQIGMLGPLIAAVLMRRWVRAESFGSSLRWTRSWRAYLFAVLAPTGLVVATILINEGIGLGYFRWAGDSVLTMLPAFMLILPLATISAIGEEYGWRGYLLPRLLHGNNMSASIAMGLIWGLWHLPLLITGLSVPDQPVVLVIPVFLFTIIMLSFLFTWLHWISGGSLWTAALLHGTLNALTEFTSTNHYPNSNQLVVGVFGLTSGIILLIGVIVYYLVLKHDLLAQGKTYAA